MNWTLENFIKIFLNHKHTGTLPDAKRFNPILEDGTVLTTAANIAHTNVNNNFSASQTITGTVTATTFSGSGSSLTGVPDSALSSNVALKNQDNNFTATQTIKPTLDGGLTIYPQTEPSTTSASQNIYFLHSNGGTLSCIRNGYDSDATDSTRYTDLSLIATQSNSKIRFFPDTTETLSIAKNLLTITGRETATDGYTGTTNSGLTKCTTFGAVTHSGTIANGGDTGTLSLVSCGNNGSVEFIVISAISTDTNRTYHAYELMMAAHGQTYNDASAPLLSRLTDGGIAITHASGSFSFSIANTTGYDVKYEVKSLNFCDVFSHIGGY